LNSVFRKFDENGDGVLTTDEFQSLLMAMGINDDDEQKALIALADTNNNQKIDFDEFRHLIKVDNLEKILSIKNEFNYLISLYELFRSCDLDNDGQVSWADFYTYFTEKEVAFETIALYWQYIDFQKNQYREKNDNDKKKKKTLITLQSVLKIFGEAFLR